MAGLSDDAKLVDVFNESWKLYHDLNESSEPSTSTKLQQSINAALKTMHNLSKTVEQLSMFSRNEELEEVATSDLRYFLLPALTASLITKQQCDRSTRPQLLEDSMQYFIGFLKLCLDYHIGNTSEIEKLMSGETCKDSHPPRGRQDLEVLNAARNAKIAKYRKAKLQAEQIQEMESKLHDDEISRKYWLTQIDRWIDVAIDEVTNMRMEKDMLDRMKNVSQKEIEESRKPAKEGRKPFILTKNKLQASVFGAGYPSVPTVTLEEFFEKEVAAGRLPDQATKPAGDHKNDDADSENDDENVKKQREFDDWKDTHRRGAGNRKNMG